MNYTLERAKAVLRDEKTTREDLAERSGVSISWLNKVLAGSKVNVNVDKIQGLIFALDDLEKTRKAT